MRRPRLGAAGGARLATPLGVALRFDQVRARCQERIEDPNRGEIVAAGPVREAEHPHEPTIGVQRDCEDGPQPEFAEGIDEGGVTRSDGRAGPDRVHDETVPDDRRTAATDCVGAQARLAAGLLRDLPEEPALARRACEKLFEEAGKRPSRIAPREPRVGANDRFEDLIACVARGRHLDADRTPDRRSESRRIDNRSPGGHRLLHADSSPSPRL